MHVRIPAERLRRPMQVLERITQRPSLSPSAASVLIEATADRITFTASNGTFQATLPLGAGPEASGGDEAPGPEVLAPGRVLIPCHRLSRLVPLLARGQDLCLRLTQGAYGPVVRLEGAGFHMSLHALDPDLLSLIPASSWAGAPQVRAEAGALYRAMDRVRHAIAADDFKEYLMAACLEVRDGRMHWVGADRYRCAHATVPLLPPPDGERRAVIPREAIALMERMLPTDGEAAASEARLVFPDRAVHGEQAFAGALVLETVYGTLLTGLLPPAYIGWRGIFRGLEPHVRGLRPDDLLMAFARIDVLAADGDHLVELRASTERQELELYHLTGAGDEARSVLPAMVERDLRAISNVRYLMEAVRQIPEEVAIAHAPGRPLRLYHPSEPEAYEETVAVMAVRGEGLPTSAAAEREEDGR